jgi:hypothetical protein
MDKYSTVYGVCICTKILSGLSENLPATEKSPRSFRFRYRQVSLCMYTHTVEKKVITNYIPSKTLCKNSSNVQHKLFSP